MKIVQSGWKSSGGEFRQCMLLGLALAGCLSAVAAHAADSLDQLYEKAKKEGRVTVYAPLSTQTEKVLRGSRSVLPDLSREFAEYSSRHR